MIALSLRDIFGQKDGTTILERFAFLLSLSIYIAVVYEVADFTQLTGQTGGQTPNNDHHCRRSRDYIFQVQLSKHVANMDLLTLERALFSFHPIIV